MKSDIRDKARAIGCARVRLTIPRQSDKRVRSDYGLNVSGDSCAIARAAPQGRPKTSDDARFRTLADLGVSPTSHRTGRNSLTYQTTSSRLRCRTQKKPTTNGIIAAHTEPRQSPVDPRALWLWGRLLDFEREGLLDTDPNALTRTMLEHMQTTTKEMAPRVAAWLGRIGNDG